MQNLNRLSVSNVRRSQHSRQLCPPGRRNIHTILSTLHCYQITLPNSQGIISIIYFGNFHISCERWTVFINRKCFRQKTDPRITNDRHSHWLVSYFVEINHRWFFFFHRNDSFVCGTCVFCFIVENILYEYC